MLTTESTKTKAFRLAKLLVQKKLAACVSIKKIFSTYHWEDQIEETKEFELTIKSKPELKDDLINFLRKISTYDVPQIVYNKYHSEKQYFDWLNKAI